LYRTVGDSYDEVFGVERVNGLDFDVVQKLLIISEVKDGLHLLVGRTFCLGNFVVRLHLGKVSCEGRVNTGFGIRYDVRSLNFCLRDLSFHIDNGVKLLLFNGDSLLRSNIGGCVGILESGRQINLKDLE
jgi:hypothetical protein